MIATITYYPILFHRLYASTENRSVIPNQKSPAWRRKLWQPPLMLLRAPSQMSPVRIIVTSVLLKPRSRAAGNSVRNCAYPWTHGACCVCGVYRSMPLS